jgi:hypothetical protein
MRGIFSAGAACAALALVAGCSSSSRKIVPVSGVVTVDGNPAENLIVSFQPIADEGDSNPGRGSSAVTDSHGRFRLVYDGQKPGALAGKHRVRIFPQMTGGAPAEEGVVQSERGKAPRPNFTIPPEWNDQSKVEFEVPGEGTDQANFNIDSKTPPKK